MPIRHSQGEITTIWPVEFRDWGHFEFQSYLQVDICTYMNNYIISVHFYGTNLEVPEHWKSIFRTKFVSQTFMGVF